MLLAFVAVLIGLVVLVWSADRFVSGAASVAHYFAMSPLLIGMLIVGFGTSAPEMVVSALASWQGNPGIALGNAYGSNISNIALILGITALISPIVVHSKVLRKELPILTLVTALAAWQLWDGMLSGTDAAVLLAVFLALMFWAIYESKHKKSDPLAEDMAEELSANAMPIKSALLWLVVGLLLLIASSRALVWGAVEIARSAGVSDLVIGLTVVAIGTSLPELASSIVAARKNEHDIAFGNIIGSNLFNTLVVVGIAGSIRPIAVGAEIIHRDMLVMGALTISLFALGYGFGKPGRISRIDGGLLVAAYIGYTAYLVSTTFIAK